MRGFACSHCGARPKGKLKPPITAKTLCPICGKPLTVKMSTTETMVVAKVVARTQKRKPVTG